VKCQKIARIQSAISSHAAISWISTAFRNPTSPWLPWIAKPVNSSVMISPACAQCQKRSKRVKRY